MEEQKIRIAITHGDTNGIGYEVIFKAFEDPAMLELCTPIIYGSPRVATFHSKGMNLQVPFSIINDASEARDGQLNLLTCFNEEVKVEFGTESKEAGLAALCALERAVKDYQEGLFDVLVTAPINKNSIQGDNFHFPGHTEYIAERLGNGAAPLMILMNRSLRVALTTTHLPVKDIASAITKEAVVEKTMLLHRALKRDFRITSPRIAILALNPHAGDGGVLGAEEQEQIIPAIEELEQKGIHAFGPYAADGFFGTMAYQHFDGVLAQYHDQGLAPFKTLAAEDGVNYTAGLPIVRTSPDHGTAFDIAGKGVANAQSMRQAIFHGIDIFRNRQNYDEPFADPLQKLYHERREDGDKARFSKPRFPRRGDDFLKKNDAAQSAE